MRQFVSSVFPDQQGLLKVSGKDYHYLHQVLRVKAGDMMSVRLPDGTLAGMTVCIPDERIKTIILQICADTLHTEKTVTRGTKAEEILQPGCETEYWLFQFAARPQKMDVIIRQAVECGIKMIVPVIGEYTQKDAAEASIRRSDRIDRIIREARQQSGSPVETVMHAAVDPADAVALWKTHTAGMKDTAAFVLYERRENSVSIQDAVRKLSDVRAAALAVGCEGGISPGEIELLCGNGFLPVHFNTNILRCETAAIYGMAVLQTSIAETRVCH